MRLIDADVLLRNTVYNPLHAPYITKRDVEEAPTVNGWVTEHSETIPEEGFSFDYQNLTITVTKAEELRTQELSVIVHSEEKTEEE